MMNDESCLTCVDLSSLKLGLPWKSLFQNNARINASKCENVIVMLMMLP